MKLKSRFLAFAMAGVLLLTNVPMTNVKAENTTTTYTFDDGTQPFEANDTSLAAGNQTFTYNEDVSLMLHDSNSKWSTYCDGVSGTAFTNYLGSNSIRTRTHGYVMEIGDEKSRPTKVSFDMKVVSGDGANILDALVIYPLTFNADAVDSDGNNKYSNHLAMDIFSKWNEYAWWGNSMSETGVGTKGATTDSIAVFSQLEEVNCDTTALYWTQSSYVTATSDTRTKADNAKIIGATSEYAITITYDWLDNNKVTISAMLNHGTNTAKFSFTVTYDPDHIADMYHFGFLATTANHHNLDSLYLMDNLTVVREQTYSADEETIKLNTLYDAFKESSNSDTAFAFDQAYESIQNDSVKKAFTDKYNEVKEWQKENWNGYDDFGSQNKTELLWTNNLEEQVTDGVVTLSGVSDKYLLSDSVWKTGNKPVRFSFDIQWLTNKTGGGLYIYVLESKTADLVLDTSNNKSEEWVYFMPVVEGTFESTGAVLSDMIVLSNLDTMTYNFTYDWSNWNPTDGAHPSVSITISCTNNATGVTDSQALTYAYTGTAEDKPDTFTVGFESISADSEVVIDNVVLDYQNTDDEGNTNTYIGKPASKVQFVAKHSEILNKTYDELDTSDLTAINAAIEEYEALKKYAYLQEEIDLLEVRQEYLRNIDVLGDLDTDDINACLEAWRIFKNGTEKLKTYCKSLYTKVYETIKQYDAKYDATDEAIDILANGHSMVAGAGASSGKDYPSQLQVMLDETYGDGTFDIVNKAIPGYTINDLLEQSAKVESYNPDIIILSIGANDFKADNDVFLDEYTRLIDSYRDWKSAPTIILTTDFYMTNRDNAPKAEIIRNIARAKGVPLVDTFTMTYEAYQADLEKLKAEYIASGSYASEADAIAAAETACFELWDCGDGIHYTDYGYQRYAEFIYAELEHVYCDFNIQYADMKNVIYYGNEWDESYLEDVTSLVAEVEALSATDEIAVAECYAAYDSLNELQKMKFEFKYRDAYFQLIDAVNHTSAKTEVDAFKNTHSTILEADSYDITMLSDYVAAEKAYETLSDTAQRMLADEKLILDDACEVIKPLAIAELTSKGVTGEKVYTTDMLLAANSEMNTYDAEKSAETEQNRNAILSALKEIKTAYDEDVRIFCAGDNLTVGVGGSPYGALRESYPFYLSQLLDDGYQVHNGGIAGANARAMFYDPGITREYSQTSEYQYAQEYQPDIVIIMLGTYDIIYGVMDDDASAKGGRTYNAYVELVQYFQSLESAPQVIVATTPWGSYMKNNNLTEEYKNCVALQKMVAEEYGLPIIDLAALTAEWPAYDENSEVNYEMDADGLYYNKEAYELMAEEAYAVVEDIIPKQVYGYAKSTSILTETPELVAKGATISTTFENEVPIRFGFDYATVQAYLEENTTESLVNYGAILVSNSCDASAMQEALKAALASDTDKKLDSTTYHDSYKFMITVGENQTTVPSEYAVIVKNSDDVTYMDRNISAMGYVVTVSDDGTYHYYFTTNTDADKNITNGVMQKSVTSLLQAAGAMYVDAYEGTSATEAQKETFANLINGFADVDESDTATYDYETYKDAVEADTPDDVQKALLKYVHLKAADTFVE